LATGTTEQRTQQIAKGIAAALSWRIVLLRPAHHRLE
jgi:hypothetical protein